MPEKRLALDQVPSFGGDAYPVGAVSPFAGVVAPSGWLLCNGAEVSRATYAILFGIVGIMYGPGNNLTTFNLPDLRSREAIGAGQGTGLSNRVLAATGGEENHLLILNEQIHNHWAYENSSGYFFITTKVIPASGYDFSGGHGEVHRLAGATSMNSAGSGQSHNTMQTYLAVNFIIKH